MRVFPLICAAFLVVGCVEPTVVTLHADDGSASVTYRCGRWQSQIGSVTVRGIIEDYVLRIVRTTAADNVTTLLDQVGDSYERRNWPELEQVAVSHACENACLAAYEPTFPAAGTVAPEFSLEQVAAAESLRLADLRGRIVVLDFWATWCAPCLQQMPELVTLARRHAPEVVVIGIVHRDSREATMDWLGRNETAPLIHLFDSGARIGQEYGVRWIPATFVLDRDGRVMRSRKNPRLPMRYHELADWLDTL
jgi:cytochrome c biogenesis protein CcmG, thiol:disulfide interchange protein DsbE